MNQPKQEPTEPLPALPGSAALVREQDAANELYQAACTLMRYKESQQWHNLENAARRFNAARQGRILAKLQIRQNSEIPFKQWRVEEGQRLKISEHAVFNRVQRGHYPDLEFRRVNKRVVFVVL